MSRTINGTKRPHVPDSDNEDVGSASKKYRTGYFVNVDAENIDITHTSNEDDDHTVEIIHNADGFADSKALEILHSTGAQPANTEDDCILVSIDDSSAVGGEVVALAVT